MFYFAEITLNSHECGCDRYGLGKGTSITRHAEARSTVIASQTSISFAIRDSARLVCTRKGPGRNRESRVANEAWARGTSPGR